MDAGNLDVSEIDQLLWGESKNEELYRRWCQGFVFSSEEPMALVQLNGGPCAVLAPVQAFLIAEALFPEVESSVCSIEDVTGSDAETFLIRAMSKILLQASTENQTVFVTPAECRRTAEENNTADKIEPKSSDHPANATSDDIAIASDKDGCKGAKVAKQDSNARFDLMNLRCQRCSSVEALFDSLEVNFRHFKVEGGVLLFLYSVLMTKGLECLISELEDGGTEPLIDRTHGHGSQSLVNLLLTGRAVSQLFDGDLDVGGLKMRGIAKQPRIGFLSQMEALRYLEVGSLLKNPILPIWLMASETHLTVLFSMDKTLVTQDSARARARRAFSSRDPEGSGFIAKELLGELLSELGLCADSEYVTFMREHLDSEQLGIILLADFLEKFYPEEEQTSCLRETSFYFGNNLCRSNPEQKVRFQQLSAVIPEFTDMDVVADYSAIQQCIATRWPTIQLTWTGHDPSLN